MTMSLVADQVAPKTYFSLNANFGARITNGRWITNTAGQQERVDEKFVQFSPAGGGPGRISLGQDYGMLTTQDPEVIAWMDRAIAEGRQEIMTAEEYNRRITPAEMREQMLLTANQKLIRQLEERNALVAKLEAKNKEGK